MERQATIKSGKLLEIEYYPVFSDGRRVPERAPKTKRTTEAQEKYNEQRKIKNFVRTVNANFTDDDYFCHPTYATEHAPLSEEAARRDVKNALRRIKYARERALITAKASLAEVKEALQASPRNSFLKKSADELTKKVKKLSSDFKYAYVIEVVTYKSGKLKGMSNYHFHMFLTGGLDAAEIEAAFRNMRCNCSTFKPHKFGPEAAAKYMLKCPQGKRTVIMSQNMKKPKVTHRDGAISAKSVEKLCRERFDDREYWEKKYKGYRFLRAFPRVNPYNGHYYLSVVMYQADKSFGELPDFSIDDWGAFC